MLNLSSFPKFQKDIQSNVVNIHPVVIIRSNPEIYLSQNEEVLTVAGIPQSFKANNLKVPSVKESIDLESRNIKINNITLTFSNVDRFSDLFATQNFLNVYVDIYWKTQSATSIEECLPVYKAVIKRVTHDYKNVKLILEDLTQSVLHKEVPITTIPFENAYNSKDVNKLIPMVYGGVDNAPCVLWKDLGGDTATNKYIHVLADRFDMPIALESDSVYDANELYYAGDDSHLSIFSGTYAKVNKKYYEHTNNEDYGDVSQTLVENNWNDDYGSAARVRLVQRFNAEYPLNSLADNVLQVVQRRPAASWSLIDFTGTENSISYDYLGNDNNIYAEDPELALGEEETSFNDYSNIPDSSLNSFADVNSEEGLITLTSFQNGLFEGNNTPFAPHTSRISISNLGIFYSITSTTNQKSYDQIAKSLLYHVHSKPVDIEFIKMPTAKTIYGWFVEWYDTEHPNEISIRPWNYDEDDGHRWGTPFDFDEDDDPSLDSDENFATEMLNFRHTSEVTNWQFLAKPSYNNWNYTRIGVAAFPRYLFKIKRATSNVNDPHCWITFEKDFEGNPQAGYYVGGLPNGAISIDFWDLVAWKGYTYDDFPRYKINYQEGIDNSGFTVSNASHGTWIANYKVGWNGVDVNTWDNQYPGQNEHCGNTSQFEAYNIEEGLPPEGVQGDHDFTSYPINDEWDSLLNWNNFFVDGSWYINILDSYDEGNMSFKKGTLISTALFNPIAYGDNAFGNTWNSELQDGYISGQQMLPGIAQSFDTDYFKLKYGGELSIDNRLACLFSLSDSDLDDVITGSGVTYFYGKVGLKVDSEHVTNTSATSLKLKFLEADVLVDEGSGDPLIDSLESDGVGDLKTSTLSSLVSSPDQQNWYNARLGSRPVSYDWSEPSTFNAGILRFQLENSNNALVECPTNVLIYHLGVKHIVDIDNALEKDFYLNTKGRLSSATNTPSSIITDIIQTELEIDLSGSLDDSYQETNNYLNGQFDMGFSQKDKINSKTLIENIAKNSPIIPLFKSNSKLGFAIIKNSYSNADIENEKGKIISSSHVISSSFDRTKIENVKTIVRVKYKKDYANDEYGKVTKYTDAYDFFGNGDLGYENGYKKDYYGLDPYNPGDSVLEFESDYIRQDATSVRLRDFLLAYHCQQHNIIKCRLPLVYVDIEISDIVRFDSLIDGMKCYGEDYTADDVYRNGQEIYPYFMVTSVNKSTKHVDIECLQMHNLNPTFSLILGDLDRNGIVNDLDVELMQKLTTEPYPYLTEGQITAGDYNGNGKLDENDLALLLEALGEE